MRKRLTIFLLWVVLTALTLLQGKENLFFPFQSRHVRLENGFSAYLIPMDAPGQICYVTVVRSGSRDEYEPGKSGYAHFFEHMMFQGTEKYPQYNEITSSIGALSNAATSDDFTQFYLMASSEVLERIVDLESDRFMNLKYSDAQFRIEAGAILSEFNMTMKHPYNMLVEKVQDTAFDRHPYKHLAIGFERDVRNMSEGYGNSLDFYRRYYRPENCVLLLAGDFDCDRAETLIRKYYTTWKPGYRLPRIRQEPKQTSLRRATVSFHGSTLPILSVNYKGPAWSATDRTAVAAEVLGTAAFGERSELYKKLVFRDRSVQSLTTEFELRRDPALLSVTAIVTDPSSLPLVESEIADTVRKFQNELCGADLLEDIKQSMKYNFLMNLETPRGVCFALRRIVAFTGGIEAIENYARTLASVTPEDVRTAAGRYLVDSGKTIVTLVPDVETE